MNRLIKHVALAGLALAIAIPLAAQDQAKKNKKAGANPLANFVKKAKEANLSEEQAKKVEELAAEYGKKIAAANAKLGEAGPARAQARKDAVAAGKKGKDLQAAVDAAVKLTDEQKAAVREAEELNQQFRAEVAKLLNEEQKEKLGLTGKKKKAA